MHAPSHDQTAAAHRLADEIDRQIRTLDDRGTAAIRGARRTYSTQLRDAPTAHVVAVAHALVDRRRWVAYELLYHHAGGIDALTVDDVMRLGTGMADWGAVDAFGRYISGPAWQRRRIADGVVRGWAASPDRWWRRAALVSTVPLNLRSAGGTGDTARTLDICARLAPDHDDMVIKALSWALRELIVWDRAAVQAFLDAHDDMLAARVNREVRNKLTTGLKTPSKR